jgi:DNA replication protein DnaC
MRKHRIDRSKQREEISGLLRRLAFSQTGLRLCAEEGSAAQEEFLLRVLRAEAANREEVRKARYLREAGFPVYKTLEGYEYQNLRLPPALARTDLAAGAFIKDRKNLVLYGSVGTGKTHLATALGVAACERSIRTRFFTVAQGPWRRRWPRS